MGERKPSIYTDNTASGDAVGTSKELDKYGVWVKSAPQVLSVADGESQESLTPFALDDDTDALLNDSFQDALEENPVPSDDAVKQVEDTSPLEPVPSIDAIEKDSPDTTGAILDDPLVSKNQNISPLVQEEITGDLASADVLELYPSTDLDVSAIIPESEVKHPPVQDDPPVLQSLASDRAIQLLTAIVDELSLIRNELSGFKDALIHVGGVSQEKQIAPKTFDSLHEGEEEKITLTGNELNHILNAPDFTEELKAEILKDIGADLSDNDLSLDDLNFLMQDPYGSHPFPPDDTADLAVPSLDILEDAIVLEDAEEIQRLIKEGDKPITEAPNEFREFEPVPPTEDLLIDDLLMDQGSVKDIPIALEDDDPLGDVRGGAEPVLPDLVETQEKDFDIADILDKESSISDEELDKLEENVLQEFSEPNKEVPKDIDEAEIPFNLREGLKTVLSYMDQLLESLPDEKIKEFRESEHFATYKKLLNELGLA